MEAELTEFSEMDLKTDYLVITEEANVDLKKKTHKHIKIDYTLILKRLAHLKRETK